MGGTIDTYFEAWNESDDAARRALIERCLVGDVVLIEEHGRFSGHDGLEALMAKFQQAVPGGRIIKTSGFDEFDGIPRGTRLMPTATPFGTALMSWSTTRMLA